MFDCLHDMGDPVGAAAHVLETLAADGTWMIVEPFAGDRLEDNLNPVGRVFYGASTLVCTPASRDQEVGLALGAQAGEARLREVVTAGGFTRFRRATETPFNLVLEAPELGGVQKVGEVSLSAEAFGVHPGMRLGEALARCPRLVLVPPDPAAVADSWERLLVRLESIGAAVEPERPGVTCFDARGLLRLHGGIEGVLGAARRALRIPARLGVAPSRFAAVAAATKARVRRPEIVSGGAVRSGGRAP